jgi:hypothetical protein
LRAADAWPSIDLLGFYSEKNPFLKHRYFGATRLPPGLVTVFVRDFGRGEEPIAAIRTQLASTFEVLAEGPLTGNVREAVFKGVRGGNWSDPGAPNGQAPPVYWFVCWDKSPTLPTRRSRRKRPRCDNERINIKYAIREVVGEKAYKAQRLVHTSDNTSEALEHAELLGCRNVIPDHLQPKAR